MTTEARPIDSNKTDLPRKPYNAPSLRVYGDIREVTKNLGGTVGKNDGGAGPDKTGF